MPREREVIHFQNSKTCQSPDDYIAANLLSQVTGYQGRMDEQITAKRDETTKAEIREGLAALRNVILDIAEEEKVGPLEETLKWGQQSFLTSNTKAGTTIRIDEDKSNGGQFALYVHCQTTLVERWRERFSDFTFGGNRSVHFSNVSDVQRTEVKIMIAETLTYHRKKRGQKT